MPDVSLLHTLSGHQNPIFTLAIGASNTLFSGGNDKGVVEWDLHTMQFRRILCAVTHSVYALHHIPNTDLLAIGLRSGEVMIVDYVQQKLVAKMKTESGAVFALQAIPEKSELIAIGEEGVAYVYDTIHFKLLYRFRVSKDTVRTIALDSVASTVYFGDKAGAIYQYSLADYEPMQQALVHTMPVTSLCLVGKQLLSGGRDAKLYQIATPDFAVQHEITPHMFTVYGIVSNADQSQIATASRDKTWKIWDPKTLTLLKNISVDRGYDSHKLSINTILWHEQRVYTAGDDKTIKVWDVSAD
ncbi:WD40 repeat domain-containing protein [Sphingobacterium sp. lm-10]|uniref:WD40 repeat domain-containing protein n=1 Tax=Sphingobacterium sp. lm-10 TaxID=2944904 RepID=UPI0020211B3A|nr:WD40 repeat domain-containing protein [Sphingobacterium sp. lm-10]MCL7989372.1 WD40 repeat domain-containing protein [Sphingobacterium sp. lm-10]